MNRYICIHGHFYQPPRENPWLERVELQDSAYPYHDWNERITEECYAPNALARILDENSRVQGIVSNYAKISYNMGPTLLAWMEKHSPAVYDSIIKADKQSQKYFGGHGSAVAQVYSHMILPLANKRDKRTQVIWGVRDFEYRFGRMPEGMWLAETAVDLDSLEALAEAGVHYTILSQYQAKRYRKLNSNDHWHDAIGGKIDPTQPYLQKLPSGRGIVIFFYDGPISRAAAFEGMLRDGKAFANRLASAFVDSRNHAQLVHIATDGETYGHHHRFGEMALSFGINHIENERLARITNYGQFLALHPPTYECDVLENTSWSCSHGIERWRNDCGCNSGGNQGWRQHWRKPFREALDWLRDTIAPAFEAKLSQYLHDPWEARDHYIVLLHNRSQENIDRFISCHSTHSLTTSEKTLVLKLLEMQRHAMLMYTSCGWFFDELSGLETVQCMQYAGRVVQLAEETLDLDIELENDFLEHLEKAPSNIPEHKNGRVIYEKMVKPAMIDILKVAAHYAVTSIFEPENKEINLYSYKIRQEHIQSFEAGKARLVIGRAHITCEITLESATVSFGALHFGDHNLNAGVRHFLCNEAYNKLISEAGEAFERVDFPGVIRILDRHFGASTYSLKSLFRDEQRKIMDRLLNITLKELESIHTKTYQDYYTLMRFLTEMGTPLPLTFLSTTNFVIDMRLRDLMKAEKLDLEALTEVLSDAKRWGFKFDTRPFHYLFQERAERLIGEFAQRPHDTSLLEDLEKFITVTKSMPFYVNLWKVQNEYYNLMKTIYPHFMKNRTLEVPKGDNWFTLFRSIGYLLSIRVDS